MINDTLKSALYNTIVGPHEHVEIIFARENVFKRVVVGAPVPGNPKGRVFETHLPIQLLSEWKFLELECTPAQIALMLQAVSEFTQEFYSTRKKYCSGLPYIPDFILDCFLAKEESPHPTFCGEYTLKILKRGGFFKYYPPDEANATDIYNLVTRFARATPIPSPYPDHIDRDRSGYQLSIQTILNGG